MRMWAWVRRRRRTCWRESNGKPKRIQNRTSAHQDAPRTITIGDDMSEIQHNARLQADTIRKETWRLIPFLMLCYRMAFIDRGNIGMASLQMNDDLGLTKKMFGFAGSLFFISYFLFEV